MPDNITKEEINVFDYELKEFIFHVKRQLLKVLLPFILLCMVLFFLKPYRFFNVGSQVQKYLFGDYLFGS